MIPKNIRPQTQSALIPGKEQAPVCASKSLATPSCAAVRTCQVHAVNPGRNTHPCSSSKTLSSNGLFLFRDVSEDVTFFLFKYV